jgi:hypothetical protein
MLPDLYERVTDYADGDLTFFMHVFHDAKRLAWVLNHLRSHYPGARAVVCSDGDDDPELPQIAAAAGAEFHLGAPLYSMKHGGRIMHRMLELYFEKPSRYLLKIDPDTGIHRRFHWLPGHSGIFGTLQSNPLLASIQGGCCGFNRDAAETLFHSEAFLSPLLALPESTWAMHLPLLQYMTKVDRVSTDWLTGYAATALNIPQFGFAEVHSTWGRYVPNADLR